MNNILVQNYKTSYGELLLGVIGDKICLCDWRYRKARTAIDQRLCRHFNAKIVSGEHLVIDETVKQLDEYFAGRRHNFTVPTALAGTSFQQTVWQHLQSTPYGKTITYQNLAETVGNAKAVRAVANASGANALSILIPCHRVIGSDGQLTGYAGGIVAKQTLISLEQANRST
ncbi:MAG: methylated-DNA-[protein]-cysteine S-methyltransferase [Cellvibrionaceae bacterium]|jgi:methylated-DNA-[protein]-cysteine S-methyltransferase